MTVYIVLTRPDKWTDGEIEAVFNTREKAETFATSWWAPRRDYEAKDWQRSGRVAIIEKEVQ